MAFILNRRNSGIQYPPFEFVEKEVVNSNCPPLPEDFALIPGKYALDCDNNAWVLNPEYEKTFHLVDVAVAKLAAIRAIRDGKIESCMWLVQRHAQEKMLMESGRVEKTTLRRMDYEALLVYIQDLRDVTNPASPSYIDIATLSYPVDMEAVTWPEMPSGIF